MPSANPYGGSFAIPDQLHVDRISFDGDLVTIHASTEGPAAECPLCEQPSRRLHGSYTRTLADRCSSTQPKSRPTPRSTRGGRAHFGRGRLQEHLAAPFPAEALPVQQEDFSGVVAGVVGPEGDERQTLAPKRTRQDTALDRQGRTSGARALLRWGYRRRADLRVSTTDPDASPTHHNNNKKSASGLGYPTRTMWWT
jgi:hypothetical protein